jgi:hypothetical protein
MAWALSVHPVLKKFGDVPDDLSKLLALPTRPKQSSWPLINTPKRRSATENPFLIKPHGKASFIARAGQSATEYQFGCAQNRKSKRRAA